MHRGRTVQIFVGDVALVVDESTSAAELEATIIEAGGEALQKVHVFDVYQGENLEAGKKSIALSVLYFNPERILKDEEVDASYEVILEKVKAEHNAVLRA